MDACMHLRDLSIRNPFITRDTTVNLNDSFSTPNI